MTSDRAEEERDEWCFEFNVSSERLVHQSEADRLLDEAIHWAGAHRLGVGGSYKPASAEVNNACVSWAFRFGLCASEDEQLIPRESASDLWDLLSAVCQHRGFICTGGFRAFTAEELGEGL
ncbi:hypothetical protein [Limnoglobus roseus]|uniref:Uncharacterized protein n=1 Tax=Limnoglobus roseus TaxID=2598579 RepID=A0A5C1AN96_9BACT|nr:hypothetical protein [Limnoglobus roseus]QEL20460.1 hypothetical protein PX52LOC_07561 [Limnoglobus roseus]